MAKMISPAPALDVYEKWPRPAGDYCGVSPFSHDRSGGAPFKIDETAIAGMSDDLRKGLAALGDPEKQLYHAMQTKHDRWWSYSDDYTVRNRGSEELWEINLQEKKLSPETVSLIKSWLLDDGVIASNYNHERGSPTVLQGIGPRLPFEHERAQYLEAYHQSQQAFRTDFLETIRDGANALWHFSRDKALPESDRIAASRTSMAIGVITGDPAKRASLTYPVMAKMASNVLDTKRDKIVPHVPAAAQKRIRLFNSHLYALNNIASRFFVAEATIQQQKREQAADLALQMAVRRPPAAAELAR